jgi:hypothetical protein
MDCGVRPPDFDPGVSTLGWLLVRDFKLDEPEDRRKVTLESNFRKILIEL